MVYVPQDIWLYIADFLPDTVLRHLFAVNSTFFNIAIDIRYREVTVNDLGDKNTTRKLLRLRDPFIAKRVRCLSLYLESNYDFFRNWKYRSKGSRWVRFVDKIARRSRGPSSAIEEIIQDLTAFVSGLPNVVALQVCARELQLHEQSGPLFAAAWKTFGANLRKLSLQGSVEYFQQPLSLADFGQLRELQLEFTDVSCVHTAPLVNIILCQTIAPAVNRFSPVLESLSLSFGLYTWGHLDVSDFLRHLDPMPHLNTLAMSIPPHKLGDPTGLLRILHDHSASLRHVKLKLDCYNWMREPGSEDRMRSLMANFVSDTSIFVNLESFEFTPTMMSKGLDIVTGYLMRSADTLTSLTIEDRFLSYEEVARLASIFFHRPANTGLRNLAINVQFFGPQLMTMLATKLPGLKRLSLCTFNWGSESNIFMFSPREHLKLDAFRLEMLSYKNIFAEWGLRDISVTLGGGQYPLHRPRIVPTAIVEVLAACIPSLQNFHGVFC